MVPSVNSKPILTSFASAISGGCSALYTVSKEALGGVSSFFRRISHPDSPIPEVGMVASDPAGLLQSARDLGNSIQEGSLATASDLGSNLSTLAAKVSGVFVGAMNFVRGVIQAEEGSAVNDGTRFYAGAVRVVRGAAEIGKGALGVTGAAMQLSGAAATARGVLSGFAIGSLVGVSVVQVAVGTTGLAYARELKEASSGYDQLQGVDQKIGYLRNKLEISDQDVTDLTRDLKEPSIKESILGLFGDKRAGFVKLFREFDRLRNKDPKTDQDEAKITELERKLNQLVTEIQPTHGGIEVKDREKFDKFVQDANLDSELGMAYAIIEFDRLKEKKVKIFDRVFGSFARKGLDSKELNSLQKFEIVKAAESKMSTSKWIWRFLMLSSALVLACGIVSKVLETLQIGKPLFLIIETAVMLTAYLMILGIDLYFVKESFKENASASDKFMMVLLTLVNSFSSLALLLGLKVAISNAEFVLPIAAFGLFLSWTLYKIVKMKKEKSVEEIRTPLVAQDDSGVVPDSEAPPAPDPLQDLLKFARDKLSLQVFMERFRRMQNEDDESVEERGITDEDISFGLMCEFQGAGYPEKNLPGQDWFKSHLWDFIKAENADSASG